MPEQVIGVTDTKTTQNLLESDKLCRKRVNY